MVTFRVLATTLLLLPLIVKGFRLKSLFNDNRYSIVTPFDYYVLAQSYPTAASKVYNEAIPKNAALWTIHGLWYIYFLNLLIPFRT